MYRTCQLRRVHARMRAFRCIIWHLNMPSSHARRDTAQRNTKRLISRFAVFPPLFLPSQPRRTQEHSICKRVKDEIENSAAHRHMGAFHIAIRRDPTRTCQRQTSAHIGIGRRSIVFVATASATTECARKREHCAVTQSLCASSAPTNAA